MYKVVGTPCLVAYVAGQSAYNFETTTGEEVLRRAMTFLKKVYPNAQNPIRAVVSRWSADPFAKGSYSFLAVGSSGDDYDVLAAPSHNGRVYWAGEHTNRHHPSTVSGAYISGIRAALEIAKHCSSLS